jgi:serine/threonine-protein kinase
MRRVASQRFTDIVPITVHDPDLPDRLVIFVNRLMELDPKKRIQTPALAQKEAEAVIESIKSGNVKKYDAEASEKAAAEYEKQMLLKEEGRGYTIMLIESNTKLQDVLRNKLKELGYRVLITNDPGRGLDRFMDMSAGEDEDDAKGCVIFGCVGLGREAMQACYNFAADSESKHVPSLMIVTEKLQRHVNHDLIGDKHQVLCMPVKFTHVQIALRKVLGIELPGA